MEDILGGDDGATAHVVQCDVAVDHGHEPPGQRRVDRARVQGRQRAVATACGGGGLHAQHWDIGREEQVGDDTVEAGGGGGHLGVAPPLVRCAYPLPRAVGAGCPVPEGARAVTDEQAQVGGGVQRLAHLAGQAGDGLVPGGVGPGLVGDEGAAQFEEDNLPQIRSFPNPLL